MRDAGQLPGTEGVEVPPPPPPSKDVAHLPPRGADEMTVNGPFMPPGGYLPPLPIGRFCMFFGFLLCQLAQKWRVSKPPTLERE